MWSGLGLMKKRLQVLERDYYWLCLAAILCFDMVLNIVIVERVPYTEIDWKAYMEEVEGYLEGEYDYLKLKGGTGPLVYPAGFVYVFHALHYFTDSGTNIRHAQYIFIGVYMATLCVIAYIYRRCKIPLPALVLCTLSKRIHSIFALRLFNDCIAMLVLYIAVAMLLNRRWTVGCLLYSAAVSIKMNVLLFAPGLGILLLLTVGIWQTIYLIVLCGLLQVAVGLPFLMTYPYSYIVRSFDLGRKFFYVWTVNWKFVDEDIFLDSRFHIFLLTLHLGTLLAFAWARWAGGLRPKRLPLSDRQICSILFCSNFIGIVFCRSLHYQFYSWYFHSIPFLLFLCSSNWLIRFLLFILIEVCWNVYPATAWSSALLFTSHLVILGSLWTSQIWFSTGTRRKIS